MVPYVESLASIEGLGWNPSILWAISSQHDSVAGASGYLCVPVFVVAVLESR